MTEKKLAKHLIRVSRDLTMQTKLHILSNVGSDVSLFFIYCR